MTCRAHFYLLNDDFSQEYADMHYDGNESEMNKKYEWEDELEINVEIDEIKQVQGDYPLRGSKDGKEFEEVIPNMELFYLQKGGNPVAVVGCSTLLMNNVEQTKEGDQLVLKVYMNDKEPLSNPVTGVYIAVADFPDSLIVE